MNSIDKINIIKQFTLDNYYECYLPTNNVPVDCIYNLYNIIKLSRISSNNIFHEIGRYKICDGSGNAFDIFSLSVVYLYIGLFCETYWDNLQENNDTPLFQISWCYYKLSAELGNCYGMSRLGNYYLDKKEDYDSAIKWYNRAMNDHCDKSSLYRRIAHSFNNKKCYDESIKYYELSLSCYDAQGSCPQDLTRKSDLYRIMGNVYNYKILNKRVAIKYYELALEHETKKLDELNYKIALISATLKDHDKAILHYNMAIKNGHPDPKTIYYNIASIFEQREEWNKLEEHCLSLINTEYADQGLLHASLAHVNKIREDYDNAIVHGKIAIEGGFDNPQIYDIMGYSCYKKHNYLDAIIYYKMAFKKGYFLSIEGLVVNYYNILDYAKAIKYININIGLYETGKFDIIGDTLGIILRDRKEYDILLKLSLLLNDWRNIIRLLNTNYNIFQEGTLLIAAEYFGETKTKTGTNTKPETKDENIDNNCLHKFIRDIVRNKIILLDTHFKFAITSDGYENAKEDFMTRL